MNFTHKRTWLCILWNKIKKLHAFLSVFLYTVIFTHDLLTPDSYSCLLYLNDFLQIVFCKLFVTCFFTSCAFLFIFTCDVHTWFIYIPGIFFSQFIYFCAFRSHLFSHIIFDHSVMIYLFVCFLTCVFWLWLILVKCLCTSHFFVATYI